MFNQDEGKIECAVGNRAGQESRECFDLINTAKFKQLD